MANFDLGLDAGRHGFTLKSYKDDLASPREISFTKRYYISSLVEKPETHFREWDVAVLLNYNNFELNVQQSTLLCVLTSKIFYDGLQCGKDNYVGYICIVIGEGK